MKFLVEEKDWAQLGVQHRQVGIYSQHQPADAKLRGRNMGGGGAQQLWSNKPNRILAEGRSG